MLTQTYKVLIGRCPGIYEISRRYILSLTVLPSKLGLIRKVSQSWLSHVSLFSQLSTATTLSPTAHTYLQYVHTYI